MISLAVYVLYELVFDIPRAAVRVVIDLLNTIRRPFRFTVLLIKILWGEYFAYAVTAALALVFKGGLIESLHKAIEAIYLLQLSRRMKAWWDGFFGVPGTLWNLYEGLPKTLPMTVLKIAIFANLITIGVVLSFAFAVLMSFKVVILVFAPELAYRLFRYFASGESIELGSPCDYYNPFDPKSVTKRDQRRFDKTLDELIRDEDEDCRRFLEEEERRRQDVEAFCPGFYAPSEWNDGKEDLGIQTLKPRQRQSVARGTERGWTKKTLRQEEIRLPMGMLRAGSPGHFTREEAERIAKRQAQKKLELRQAVQQAYVPGVRRQENPYMLKPKENDM